MISTNFDKSSKLYKYVSTKDNNDNSNQLYNEMIFSIRNEYFKELERDFDFYRRERLKLNNIIEYLNISINQTPSYYPAIIYPGLLLMIQTIVTSPNNSLYSSEIEQNFRTIGVLLTGLGFLIYLSIIWAVTAYKNLKLTNKFSSCKLRLDILHEVYENQFDSDYKNSFVGNVRR